MNSVSGSPQAAETAPPSSDAHGDTTPSTQRLANTTCLSRLECADVARQLAVALDDLTAELTASRVRKWVSSGPSPANSHFEKDDTPGIQLPMENSHQNVPAPDAWLAKLERRLWLLELTGARLEGMRIVSEPFPVKIYMHLSSNSIYRHSPPAATAARDEGSSHCSPVLS